MCCTAFTGGERRIETSGVAFVSPRRKFEREVKKRHKRSIRLEKERDCRDAGEDAGAGNFPERIDRPPRTSARAVVSPQFAIWRDSPQTEIVMGIYDIICVGAGP